MATAQLRRVRELGAFRHMRERRGMSGPRVGASVLGLIVSSAAIATAGELGAVDSVVASAVGMVSIHWLADSYAEAVGHHLT